MSVFTARKASSCASRASSTPSAWRGCGRGLRAGLRPGLAAGLGLGGGGARSGRRSGRPAPSRTAASAAPSARALAAKSARSGPGRPEAWPAGARYPRLRPWPGPAPRAWSARRRALAGVRTRPRCSAFTITSAKSAKGAVQHGRGSGAAPRSSRRFAGDRVSETLPRCTPSRSSARTAGSSPSIQSGSRRRRSRPLPLTDRKSQVQLAPEACPLRLAKPVIEDHRAPLCRAVNQTSGKPATRARPSCTFTNR